MVKQTSVQELFSPKKSEIHDVPYTTLLKQVCLKHKEKRSWRVFQPKRILNIEVHINPIEFTALMLVYMVFLAEFKLRPNEFPLTQY